VTGKDAKGRKQYIYHTLWNEARNNNKFALMIKFGENLPLIRERVEQDLRKHLLSKEKVIAIIIKLLEYTLIRIGNQEYAKANGSYGLTTLRNRHIDISGNKVRFMFKGKSGKFWEVDVDDKRLVRLVKQCQELPGQQLFQYMDEDGKYQSVSSQEVNSYLKSITDYDFTAKDFRTWGGTVMAAAELYYSGKCDTEKECKKKITAAVRNAAAALNNTISVCRKYYIHPEIINSYLDGTLFKEMEKAEKRSESLPFGLEKEETAVLNLLRLKQTTLS
jgi:DNA topoisomerase-1